MPLTRGQNVVMCQLGLVGRGEALDSAAFQEYLHLFIVDLSEEQCLAIEELLGGTLDAAL